METAAAAGRWGRREHAARERLATPVRYALRRLRLNSTRTLIVALGHRRRRGGARDDRGRQRRGAGPRRAARARAARSRPTARSRRSGAACPAQSNLCYAQLDRIARGAIEPILGQQPFARRSSSAQATWGGAFVNLGAVDGLARWLDLRSGRLPQRCTPSRLRADPDRRRARRAEAPVPPRRRPRDVQARRAALGVLRRRRRQAPADPARRRRRRRSITRRCPTRR